MHGPGSGSVKQYASCSSQLLQHGMAAVCVTVRSEDATMKPTHKTTSMVSLRNSLSLSVRFMSLAFLFEVC